ncbi:MAG: hypothetical protein OEZ06_22750 [Myxococcales bacterium]|nr:hypothetical protein [Myxococcales bacterium]
MWLVITSLLLSLAIYAALWGPLFGLALIGGMYAHELGHVLAMRRRGLRTGPPIFVPFVGAVVPIRDRPRTARDEIAVALWGPLAGLAVALVCGLLYLLGGSPTLGLLALLLGALNLVDLLPVGPLDGGRIRRALGRRSS